MAHGKGHRTRAGRNADVAYRHDEPHVASGVAFRLGDLAGKHNGFVVWGLMIGRDNFGKDHFSIRWTGRLIPPASGSDTFLGDSDGLLRLSIDDTRVLDKNDRRLCRTSGRPSSRSGCRGDRLPGKGIGT